MQLYNSTYYPLLLIRFIIKNIPTHPVSPKPYIFPNSTLPLRRNESPKSIATNIGPVISSYVAMSLSLNPLCVRIARNFNLIFSISISNSSKRGGSFAKGLLGSIDIFSYYYCGNY